MFPQSLTASALRAIQSAGRLAESEKAPALSAAHLLWALVLQESRAASILDQYGLDDAELRRCEIVSEQSLDAELNRMQAQQAAGDPESFHPPQSVSPAELDTDASAGLLRADSHTFLEQVLASADQLARGLGSAGEIGSDHLLGGILAVESPMQGLLQNYGLVTPVLMEQLQPEAGGTPQSLPIELDFNTDVTVESERTRALRIVDAAANRTREGLRTLEDYTRFVLDDRALTHLLKQLRHDLAETLQMIETSELIIARDTTQDVGTPLTSAAEAERESMAAVATAACKRIQEGFRSLEEFGKLLSPAMGERFKQLRYRSYVFEQRWGTDRRANRLLEGRNLYLLATSAGCPGDVYEAVRLACVNGVSLVQVREKEMTDRDLVEHIRRLRPIVKQAGALLIVNDRPDLAVLSEADGVHVGQDELSVRDARRIVGPERLVGVSTHSLEQARLAVEDGADYLGVGPTFRSRTKSFSELAGLELVRQVAAEITRPWYAIGGITLDNLSQVIAAGATRVAVTNAICGSASPGEMAARFRELLSRRRLSPKPRTGPTQNDRC